MSRFQNKVAIVTGGASGIGFATCKVLANEGAKVVIADINTELGKDSAKRIGGDCVFMRLDIGDPESVQSVVDFTEAKFGGLDLAVNAAGIQGPLGKLLDLTPDDIARVYRVNTCGTAYWLRFTIPAMQRRHGGSIVNICSICGLRPTPGLGVFSSSKQAVEGLTSATAAEYGKDNIRINTISPGYVDTPLLDARIDRKWVASITPTGRCGQPEDLAQAICFLLSDAARQITGIDLPVDGGIIASMAISPPAPDSTV